MSYVDSFLDKEKDRIHIVERDKNGNRIYKEYPAEFVFYYDDPRGKFQTIYRTPVSKFTTHSSKEFRKELKMQNSKKTWEADCNPVFRCLETNYMGIPSPKLHTCFLDIESDWSDGSDGETIGYAPTDNPFNKITAITVYLDWLDKLITLAIPPKTLSWESAIEISNKFENTYIFEKESEMLDTFLNLIEDADVLSGWNSEGYDIPYTIGRITRSLAKDDLRRLCLWNQLPKKRTFERFGTEHETYDLVGRVHLDYMQLYRKYTYEERHSYSLDAIGEYELNERKVLYDGSLDQLYNQDFYKFLDYNRQDVILLKKLDQKLKLLDLTNELAHDNTVLLSTTLGVVAVTDQAIINESHQLGFIAPNKVHQKNEIIISEDGSEEKDYSTQAAGAYVAYPKIGTHQYIGAIDINSLYPSTIRALNMAPETIVGQLRPVMTDKYIKDKISAGSSFASAWEGLFGSLEYTSVMNLERGTEITIDWVGDTMPTVHTADEVWRIIFEGNNKWMISANGTIFTYEVEGIIPGLLKKWYADRQDLQLKKKEATNKEEIAFWDKKQHVKKIQLNSLYGALLNPGSRFFDQRLGQSTTLTGRIITKHMNAFINESITDDYNHVGDACIYSDTDSSYFSAWPLVKDDVATGKMIWDKDICIQLYDSIAKQVNDSFPTMMENSCHCPRERGILIKGGRELIATSGLFITKKRYAVLIYDLEGIRLDQLNDSDAKKKGVTVGVGKVKAMGLDLKRSDTPKVVQDFLSSILFDTLIHTPKEKIIENICEFKHIFTKLPAWEKGTPKRVNNLTNYTETEERQGKSGMPGHVRAALNWNNLRRMHGDNYSMKIVDGMKIIVCKLKSNPIGYTSVAYPIDVMHIPAWFKELPFDDELMEATIVDKKVENLLGVLKWDLASSTNINSTFNSLFSVK